MEERLKFVIGQKKRYLNKISEKMTEFKLKGKNLGVCLTIENDGHLRTPRDFVDLDLPVLTTEYAKLSKKEKRAYDEIYATSTTCLIENFNEANKRYNTLFEELDVYDKMDCLKEEINNLFIDQKRANAYFATVGRQSEEKMQSKFDTNKKLSESELLEINEEVTQIKYLSKQIELKQNLLAELRKSL